MKSPTPPPEWLALGFFGLMSAGVSILIQATKDEPGELGKAVLRGGLSAVLTLGIIALISAVKFVDFYVGVGIAVFIAVIGVQAAERVLIDLIRGPFRRDDD